MEKIFLFIIIMIISSVLSKKKKKKAAERAYSSKEKTTYFDDRGGSASNKDTKKESLSQLQDLLARYGADRKQESVYEKSPPVETPYEVFSEELPEENYKERFPQKENRSAYEDHSVHSVDFKAEQKEAYYDDYKSYDNLKNKSDKERISPHSWGTQNESSKPKTILAELFGSRNKLKRSIIAAEVLNRKYI